MGLTQKQYSTLDEAYQYFNKKLFEGKLPDCIITLQRKKGAYGYLSFERFAERDGKNPVTELALNPDNFVDRTDMEILGTLVHEQCHLFQNVFGEMPRKGYHDWEFANIMENIGLITTSNGESDGKRVGQKMTHRIEDGGKFEIDAGAFLLGGKKLLLESIPIPKVEREKKKTREKFVCPSCLQSCQAKKTAHLMCADCKEIMVVED